MCEAIWIAIAVSTTWDERQKLGNWLRHTADQSSGQAPRLPPKQAPTRTLRPEYRPTAHAQAACRGGPRSASRLQSEPARAPRALLAFAPAESMRWRLRDAYPCGHPTRTARQCQPGSRERRRRCSRRSASTRSEMGARSWSAMLPTKRVHGRGRVSAVRTRSTASRITSAMRFWRLRGYRASAPCWGIG